MLVNERPGHPASTPARSHPRCPVTPTIRGHTDDARSHPRCPVTPTMPGAPLVARSHPRCPARHSLPIRAGISSRPPADRLGLLDLGGQRADVGQGPLNPLRGKTGRGAPVLGQADVAPHGAFGRAKGPAPVNGRKLEAVTVAEPDADGGPEQPGEHVSVHERAQVAEHGFDLHGGIFRDQTPEELLVALTWLGHFHALAPDSAAPGAAAGAWCARAGSPDTRRLVCPGREPGHTRGGLAVPAVNRAGWTA